jgi:UDP-glucuronate decarboxylase
VYDNLSRNALRFTPFLRHTNLEFIQGDVLDAGALEQAMEGSDVAIHCAAIAGIYSVVKRPTMTMKVNFLGAYNALEAAVKNKVKLFLEFSTSEVYGPYVYKGSEENLTSQGPVGEKRWSYAVSKLAAEHFGHAYRQEYGLPIITVRPFNIYGPRQVGEGAIRQMILSALKNEAITLFNDGSQIRAWCYVQDFVDAVMLCLASEKAVGNVFNIGNPQGTMTNLNLAQTVIRLAGSSSSIVYKLHPGPEVEMRIPSIQKAQTLLGYAPKVGLDEGIARTIEWYRSRRDDV